VRFSVLVNGNPSNIFSSSRGLRQGDPLSPFLFIIIMEALSKMLIATVGGGLLLGFSVGSRHFSVVKLSHLLFTDQTLVFWGANHDHLCYLCALFLYFEAVFDLKVNLAKSELVLVGNVDWLASILVCGVSSFKVSWSSAGGLLQGQVYLGWCS
jgi:hypothetical protein